MKAILAFLARRLCWVCRGHEWLPAGELILTHRVVEECAHCEAVRLLPPTGRPGKTLFVDLDLKTR